jgi:hypothetical protein
MKNSIRPVLVTVQLECLPSTTWILRTSQPMIDTHQGPIPLTAKEATQQMKDAWTPENDTRVAAEALNLFWTSCPGTPACPHSDLFIFLCILFHILRFRCSSSFPTMPERVLNGYTSTDAWSLGAPACGVAADLPGARNAAPDCARRGPHLWMRGAAWLRSRRRRNFRAWV